MRARWRGSFKDECEHLPKLYCIFFPVHGPERNADPVKPYLFFLFVSPNARLRRRGFSHFSDHILG